MESFPFHVKDLLIQYFLLRTVPSIFAQECKRLAQKNQLIAH